MLGFSGFGVCISPHRIIHKNSKVLGNINSKNSDSYSVFENPFVRTLFTSVLMAVFLVDMSLGLYGFFSTKSSSLPGSAAFLIFAVVFIAGLVFYEKHGVEPIVSLLGGAVSGFGFSFIFIFLVGGFQFAIIGGISEIGLEQITSAIAASMIISVIMLKLFSCKLHDFVY